MGHGRPGTGPRRNVRVAGMTRRSGRTSKAPVSRLRRVFVVLTPVVVGLVIAWLTPAGPWLINKIVPGPKVSASVSFYKGTCDTFWVPDTSDATKDDPDFATPDWAARNGAAQTLSFSPGRGMSMIQITVTGYDARPVTVTGLSFRTIAHRDRPTGGRELSQECGGETIARYADVDLDSDPPRITSSSAMPVSYGSDERTTPLSFPYKVTNTDTESLLLVGSTTGYTEWTAQLAWSNGVESGTLTIDNGGVPFRTASLTSS